MIAQSLCAFGCSVDLPNTEGQYPLHLAAKNGHMEIVRCLCLAGCNTGSKNKDGLTPDISALANGHTEICDLLKRLKRVRRRRNKRNEIRQTGKMTPRPFSQNKI